MSPPLGCWAIAKLYKLDQDQHTLERLSGIAQTEASKRDDMTAQGMLLCVSKPPTQRPTVMPRQTPAFPVTQDPSAPKGNNALVVSFRQTPDAETQASSQAIYKPTFDPSTDGTGSTAAIPLPSARVSRHVTQAQHRASQDLLMDEMTVLQRDLDLMFREVQNLHEFNRALQVRATAVETAQRAACVTHNPVDTFVRDYTASGQLSPSTATLLQGTEPSYGVPYLANLSHQTGLSFKSTTGLLQCVNLMVLVDTGSGLNFISQSMADSLGHDPLPCHHKTIAFNDVKSSLTKEIQMPVIFCSETPNEISVRATFVIAPDNTIFDALIGTPLMAMPGISALPDISQEKLTLRPFLHLSSAEHTATAFYMTLLMHMVTHAHSMESYSYETNSDNTLYLGDVNLLHRIQKSYRATKTAVSIALHSPTPAGDNYKEPQDFFTTQLDDVYWRPGQEFLGGQAAVYQASTSCALPVHLDPPTPASLLPGRLQGGLTSCLSHMDPNYLQEGGINNSMPDGAVTPNADRGALHPDCDLFIGHHRDGTEAQRKEMAAMLNRMTPAVARTMEDLREGYKGIVPPMHIEKDNDKQAFTSPYRKPPIEKLAQDKSCSSSDNFSQLSQQFWRSKSSTRPGRQLDTDLRLAAMSKDTDGLDIHSDQFVLEYLRRGVLGSNWTTSLPVEDWFCPNCKASGITAIPAGRIPETPQKEPNLFPTPQTRSRDRAALACDKMLVIKQVRVQGGLDKAVWGTASFQGPLSRPWHPTHTILASEDNPSCEVYSGHLSDA
eukprot:gene26181-biopygen20655